MEDYKALVAELLASAKPGDSLGTRAAEAIKAVQEELRKWEEANSTLITARNQAAAELVVCEREKAALKKLVGPK